MQLTESDYLACCGSRTWARRMVELQPFQTTGELLDAAGRVWRGLATEEWLAAFAAHPRIGERSANAQAAQEQSGARSAGPETLARLAAGNRTYEQKFGYIYIVCATGKTAPEMLAILEARLLNDPAVELTVAAEQQRQITELRLRKRLGL